jgi:hypothetical protein
MKRRDTLRHEFVEFIPRELEDGVLYVSMVYATAIHSCCYGCGNRVVTPLSPADWKLIFDGRSISLEPSIGNWSFPCQSHYWITKNNVILERRWSKREIPAVRRKDAHDTAAYFGARNAGKAEAPPAITEKTKNKKQINKWFDGKDS